MKTTHAYASRMKALTVFSLTVLLVAGCREKPMEKTTEKPPAEVEAHRAEIAQWQERRATRLKAEDGWLSLIGLFWLNEGNNVISIPSAGSPTVKLARHDGVVTLEPGAGMVIDGPFAETKEQLLGLYVVNCDDADAALDVARDLRRVNPSAVYEIRPIRLYLPGETLPETASEGQG